MRWPLIMMDAFGVKRLPHPGGVRFLYVNQTGQGVVAAEIDRAGPGTALAGRGLVMREVEPQHRRAGLVLPADDLPGDRQFPAPDPRVDRGRVTDARAFDHFPRVGV